MLPCRSGLFAGAGALRVMGLRAAGVAGETWLDVRPPTAVRPLVAIDRGSMAAVVVRVIETRTSRQTEVRHPSDEMSVVAWPPRCTRRSESSKAGQRRRRCHHEVNQFGLSTRPRLGKNVHQMSARRRRADTHFLCSLRRSRPGQDRTQQTCLCWGQAIDPGEGG
jgi:hypothetical protein